jgi:hypothetical protein
MRAKARLLLLVTGVVEVTVGIGLFLTPSIVLVVLLGIEQPLTATLFVGRITGTAILGISIVSWLMRNDTSQASQRRIITGIAVYTIGAAVLLVYAGVSSNMVGIMLWPGAIFHTVLAIWCFACLVGSSPTEPAQIH